MYIENIVEKRRNCSLGAISPLFLNILLPVGRFSCLDRTRFSLRDKWLFEISEVEIMRVDCIQKMFLLFCTKTDLVHINDSDGKVAKSSSETGLVLVTLGTLKFISLFVSIRDKAM